MNKEKLIIISIFIIISFTLFLLGYSIKFLTIFAEENSPNPGHTISEIENGDLLATKDYVDEKFRNMSRNFTEGVALKTTGTVPVCDITNLGLMWYLEGSSGEQDLVIMCQKMQNGDYRYRDLITGNVANWWGSGLSDYGKHNQADCVAAGGIVVSGDNEEKQCKFTRSTCPSGWDFYSPHYTAQNDCTATITGGQGTSASCSALGHTFSKLGTSATVEVCYSPMGSNPKIAKWCCGVECHSNFDYCYSSHSYSCSGLITEIGCY